MNTPGNEQLYILMGGDGHARFLLDNLAQTPHIKPVGILDKPSSRQHE